MGVCVFVCIGTYVKERTFVFVKISLERLEAFLEARQSRMVAHKVGYEYDC